MKIIIDNNQEYTVIEREEGRIEKELKENIELRVITTPLECFSKYTSNIDKLKNETENKLIDKNISEQFEILLNYAENNREFFLDKYPSFLKNMNQSLSKKPLENIYQKVTYTLEEEENVNEVIKALQNQNSYSLFKAFIVNLTQENTYITVYSSVSGLWQIDGKLFFRKIDRHSKESIKKTFTTCKIENIDEVQKDFGRVNFPVYEDLKALFENSTIRRFYKLTQNRITDDFQVDPIKYFITKEHFNIIKNKALPKNEIELKARELIKEEKNFKSKVSSTVRDVIESIANNEKELHANYENLNLRDLTSNRNRQIDEFIKRQIDIKEEELNQSIEQKRVELEKTKLELTEAKDRQQECKKEFMKLLRDGMNFDEARQTLKFHFTLKTIEFAEDLLKLDISVANQIDWTKYHDYDRLNSANKTNYDNYQKEMKYRQKREDDLKKSFQQLKELSLALKESAGVIENLNEALKERDENIEDLESELEKRSK